MTAPASSSVPAQSAATGSGIAVTNATVTYRNGLTALRNASFEVPTGTITGLVGVNGSGKSTLFKAIMGFVRVAGGRIEVLGMPAAEALRKNLIAYVPQAEEVDWNFPVLVEDVVMMGRYGHMGLMRIAKAADREAVSTALARVGMADFRKRQIGELSGGQKKRVFLARALAQDGRVIQEGRVMLVSTHNLGSVPEFCDRTVLLKNTVLAYGPTAETFTQANLEKAFGGVLRHFVLGGASLHEDDDRRRLAVITDDERPLVFYGENGSMKQKLREDGE